MSSGKHGEFAADDMSQEAREHRLGFLIGVGTGPSEADLAHDDAIAGMGPGGFGWEDDPLYTISAIDRESGSLEFEDRVEDWEEANEIAQAAHAKYPGSRVTIYDTFENRNVLELG